MSISAREKLDWKHFATSSMTRVSAILPAVWKLTNPTIYTRTLKTSPRCGRWSRSDLSAQSDEVFEQAQADVLTFFGVELGGEDVVAPDGRGETFAVGRLGRGQGRVVGFGKKAMDKIDVTAGGNSVEDRAVGADDVQLVPADLRDF